MHIAPTLDEFKALSAQGNLIPVYTDLMADFETPVSVYTKLRSWGGAAFLLESIEGGANLNRYSFIGTHPRRTIEARLGGETTITDRSGEVERFATPKDPLDVIQREMQRYRPVKLPDMPRFVGGAVGMLGYEYIHAVEPTVPLAERDVHGLPVAHFVICDTLVIFDRARQTLRLLVNAHLEGTDAETAYAKACETLTKLARTLEEGRAVRTVPVAGTGEIQVPAGNFQQAEFEAMVERGKEYVRSGDIIQVVLSQRFEKEFKSSALDLYRALRVVNPSPYMFLYDPGEFQLIGASPEVHVRLTDGKAEMRPIAGTRPRGKTQEDDLAYEVDLLGDEKELAEHLMLVDLARNDLGRVCEYGTVDVPEYQTIERYSHVMHIVSHVEGQLAKEKDAYDLMRATFPAGTVSGAPKIRAMQIIAEQEKEQRGPYAGAVCYFSYDGNLDSCIAIRTALKMGERLILQSGAGIVADSVAESEYFETVNKASGLLKAVALAENLNPAQS
ncbi:MAG: anthranilate synthase component I [Verrucomicrobiota bacterium JB022]|nr:anthranilate synthase component I [Verrucomicrobiota bacterium JB022]